MHEKQHACSRDIQSLNVLYVMRSTNTEKRLVTPSGRQCPPYPLKPAEGRSPPPPFLPSTITSSSADSRSCSRGSRATRRRRSSRGPRPTSRSALGLGVARCSKEPRTPNISLTAQVENRYQPVPLAPCPALPARCRRQPSPLPPLPAGHWKDPPVPRWGSSPTPPPTPLRASSWSR